MDGLLRDKTRLPGKAPLSAETVAKVLALPCTEPPGEVTHWTGRAVARAVGVSLRAVQRIWQAHRLQPHRIRTFKKGAVSVSWARPPSVEIMPVNREDSWTLAHFARGCRGWMI